jgi:hypothetical protein
LHCESPRQFVERTFGTILLLNRLDVGQPARKTLGTVSVDFMNGLLRQLANAGSHGRQIDEDALNFMLSVVTGIKPKDQLEAMLAVQMAAIHTATMTAAPAAPRMKVDKKAATIAPDHPDAPLACALLREAAFWA